jgi:hypothetical protein
MAHCLLAPPNLRVKSSEAAAHERAPWPGIEEVSVESSTHKPSQLLERVQALAKCCLLASAGV